MITTINMGVNKMAERPEDKHRIGTLEGEYKIYRELWSESKLVTSSLFLVTVLRLRMRGAMPFHSHASLQCRKHGAILPLIFFK